MYFFYSTGITTQKAYVFCYDKEIEIDVFYQKWNSIAEYHIHVLAQPVTAFSINLLHSYIFLPDHQWECREQNCITLIKSYFVD